jgi:hypothetical protein
MANLRTEWTAMHERYEALARSCQGGHINLTQAAQISGLEHVPRALRLANEVIRSDPSYRTRTIDQTRDAYCELGLVYLRGGNWQQHSLPEQQMLIRLYLADLRLQNNDNRFRQRIADVLGSLNQRLPPQARIRLPQSTFDLRTQVTGEQLRRFDSTVYDDSHVRELIREHHRIDPEAQQLLYPTPPAPRDMEPGLPHPDYEPIPVQSANQSVPNDPNPAQSAPNNPHQNIPRQTAQGNVPEMSSELLFRQDVQILLGKLGEYQNRLETVQREEERRSVVQGMTNSFMALAEIGRMAGDRTVMTLGLAGTQTVAIVTGFAKLTGSLGFTQVAGIAAFEPCTAIALGAISIFAMLTSDSSDGLADAIQSLHQAMADYFGQCFRNQQRIYEAILENRRYMIEDFKVPVMDRLLRIETELQRTHQSLSHQVQNVATQPLRTVIAQLDEPELLSERKFLTALNTLKHWITVEVCQSSLNGAVFVGADRPLPTEALHNYLGWFVAELITYFDNVSDSNNSVTQLKQLRLPNLQLWSVACQTLLRHLDDPRVNPERRYNLETAILESAQSVRQFLEIIRSGQLVDLLLTCYREILGMIITAIGTSEKTGQTVGELFPSDTGREIFLRIGLTQLAQLNRMIEFLLITFGTRDLPRLITPEAILNQRHELKMTRLVNIVADSSPFELKVYQSRRLVDWQAFTIDGYIFILENMNLFKLYKESYVYLELPPPGTDRRAASATLQNFGQYVKNTSTTHVYLFGWIDGVKLVTTTVVIYPGNKSPEFVCPKPYRTAELTLSTNPTDKITELRPLQGCQEEKTKRYGVRLNDNEYIFGFKRDEGPDRAHHQTKTTLEPTTDITPHCTKITPENKIGSWLINDGNRADEFHTCYSLSGVKTSTQQSYVKICLVGNRTVEQEYPCPGTGKLLFSQLSFDPHSSQASGIVHLLYNEETKRIGAHRFDLRNGTWRARTEISATQFDLKTFISTSVIKNGRQIIVIGYEVNNGKYVLYAYDVAFDAWITIPCQCDHGREIAYGYRSLHNLTGLNRISYLLPDRNGNVLLYYCGDWNVEVWRIDLDAWFDLPVPWNQIENQLRNAFTSDTARLPIVSGIIDDPVNAILLQIPRFRNLVMGEGPFDE